MMPVPLILKPWNVQRNILLIVYGILLPPPAITGAQLVPWDPWSDARATLTALYSILDSSNRGHWQHFGVHRHFTVCPLLAYSSTPRHANCRWCEGSLRGRAIEFSIVEIHATCFIRATVKFDTTGCPKVSVSTLFWDFSVICGCITKSF